LGLLDPDDTALPGACRSASAHSAVCAAGQTGGRVAGTMAR